MSENHRKEKRPDQVRAAILGEAARMAVETGLASVTLQAVANAASVTKGGLLHHFASKQALVEAVFIDMLTALDDDIDALLEQDNEPHGRFTRAYVDAFCKVSRDGASSPWAALSLSCMTDARLRDLWSAWLAERLKRHATTDCHEDLALIRYAADGLWLANLIDPTGIGATQLDTMHETLRQRTLQQSS